MKSISGRITSPLASTYSQFQQSQNTLPGSFQQPSMREWMNYPSHLFLLVTSSYQGCLELFSPNLLPGLGITDRKTPIFRPLSSSGRTMRSSWCTERTKLIFQVSFSIKFTMQVFLQIIIQVFGDEP